MVGVRGAGLRLQIVLALAGLMLLAFVPLFYAVASLTRATVFAAREEEARSVGRTLAAHISDVWATGTDADVQRVLHQHALFGQIVCAFAPEGRRIACAGRSDEAEALKPPPTGSDASARIVHGLGGPALEVVSSSGAIAIVTRMRLEDNGRGASLVRLVALYMVTFGLALLFFAYVALTRLIVRPVDRLVHAANRVAGGARTLHITKSGARELVELGDSVRAMTEKLIAEEATLIVKVDELTQTQAQLVRSERMASVGRLAAGVAHEIGNPIAALMGMQDLLLEGDLPLDTQRDFVRRMRREMERIHSVVRDLLDFARPEEKASPGGEPPAPADVCAAIEDMAGLVRMQSSFRDVRIEIDVAGALFVALPAQRLTQVLLNLVLNAGAALESAKRPRGRVTIRARADQRQRRVRIEIEDDGLGVPVRVRDRLFEPFVTTKDVGEGTGLGLAVCRGLVESAGGEIGLDTTYADGARFYVVLPAASAK